MESVKYQIFRKQRNAKLMLIIYNPSTITAKACYKEK
jgi:hypothetical protein